MIVFGSSIRNDCTNDSDIDICIFSKYGPKNNVFYEAYKSFLDEKFDVIYYDYAGSNLQDFIVKNGICVYE
ncbi:MAG: nucleotidyltransferase domain-containing protein [Desulfovibrionaceae bacterium]|nr:nucleotidyltransferase domain-containing protein [Desulfovibrionaceae bacterium]